MMRYARCAMWNSYSRQPGNPPSRGEIRFHPKETQGRTLRQAVAKWKVLQASVDRRAQALHGSRRLERLQAREQVAEDGLELNPRDVGAHAEVLADAECEVRVRSAVDAERERVHEDRLVAIRRRPEQRQLLAGADHGIAH